MERRQVLGAGAGASCTAGVALIIGGLNPALVAYHEPLLTVGPVLLAGGLLTFMYLAKTAKAPMAPATVAVRDFLPPDITPRVLQKKTEGRTSIQIDAITKTYKGRWIAAEGLVSDVTRLGHNSYMLHMRGDDELGRYAYSVHMDGKWAEQLSALNKGDWVSIVGVVGTLNLGALIDRGEIVHVGPAPEPPKVGEEQPRRPPRKRPAAKA